MADGEGLGMANISDELKGRLVAALRDGENKDAEEAAQQMLEAGVEPLAIVQQVLVPTLTQVGEQFQCGDVFLPELMMAGEAAQRVTALVNLATRRAGQTIASPGTIVIGQVEGDLHDIGRNIVVTMLSSHGFKVVDLGRDVAASAFLDAAMKEKADVVGLSALMTTTLPAARRTYNLFKEVGVRERFKIIVGGGAISRDWAEQIGADGYAPDAAAAVELCKRLLE